MHSLEERLEQLRHLDQKQNDLAKAIMEADGGNFYLQDFLFLAALNRSRSNVNGFVSLIENGNYFAAIPFVRMQIDSVLRLFAIRLVDDSGALSHDILKGLPIRKMKDRKGEKMTDSYLLNVVAKKEPWIKKVYESGSGFIHLSEKHIFGMFSGSGDNGAFQISIGPTHAHIPDEFRFEAVAAMSHCTKLIIDLCSSWLNEKTSA